MDSLFFTNSKINIYKPFTKTQHANDIIDILQFPIMEELNMNKNINIYVDINRLTNEYLFLNRQLTYIEFLQVKINLLNKLKKDTLVNYKITSIFTTTHTNINNALNILINRNLSYQNFSINMIKDDNPIANLIFDNHNIYYLFQKYFEIIEELKEPADKITGIINNIYNSIVNKENLDKMSIFEIFKSHIENEYFYISIIDLYLSELYNAPASNIEIINFIYFLRRFPLFNYLNLHYIYNYNPSLYDIIKEDEMQNLENITYKKNQNIKEEKIEEVNKNNDKETDEVSLIDFNYLTLNAQDNKKNVFENINIQSHIKELFGFENNDINIYNIMKLLIDKNPNDFVILFKALKYEEDNTFILKKENLQEILKILNQNTGFIENKGFITVIDRPNIFGLLYEGVNGILSLVDLNNFKDACLEIVESEYNVTTDSEIFLSLFPAINRDLIIRNKQNQVINIFNDLLYYIFSYFLSINYQNCYIDNFSDENINIIASNFLIDLYSVYEYLEIRSFKSLDDLTKFYPLYRSTNYKNYTSQYLMTLFFIYSSYFLFNYDENKYRNGFVSNPFYNEINSEIIIIKNYLYIFKVLKHNNKNLFPLFVFLSCSNDKNKIILKYDNKKNNILSWLDEYYNIVFKDKQINTYIFNN